MTAIGPRLLGLEHEFSVFDASGGRVDMREVIDHLPFDGVRADPGDLHAVRGTHGGVVTADGKEAEIATPPIACSPAALGVVGAHARAALGDLRAALDPAHTLAGYSTHLNVSCRDRRCRDVSDRLARRWAPALMLLTLRADSPGLLVRPRWRRLELGCEFLTDAQWQPALAFAAGAVAAAERHDDGALPRLTMRLAPSAQRFGWYVDRTAFGPDLLEGGRSCSIHANDGSARSAQDMLAAAWAVVRPGVSDMFESGVVDQLDALVDGRAPLPCEADEPRTPPAPCAVDASAIHRLPLTYRVDDIVVRPSALTWRRGVFEVTRRDRSRWITVDGTRVRDFYEALHAGRLDDALRAGRRHLNI